MHAVCFLFVCDIYILPSHAHTRLYSISLPSRQRQEHLNNLETLKLRRETLEQARRKHLSLKQEIEEALKKSQERLERAVAASIRVNDPNAVSAAQDDDEDVDENMEESNDVDMTTDSSSLPPTEVQIPVPQLHRNETIMQDFWKVSSDGEEGLVVFLPCLNSVDVIRRLMNVTALETLALDKAHPDHRLESVKKTCLDFFCTASKSIGEEGMQEQVRLLLEENKQEGAIIDPNVALCPYELAGVCADAFCPYQHIRPRSTPNLAWELLPLPKLTLPETPGDERTEEPPKKRPRTEKDDGSSQTIELLDERKKKEGDSYQSLNPSNERKEQVNVNNQTVDPCDAGMEKGAEIGSKSDHVATIEWNDDFVSLPPISKAAEEDDSVSSDGIAGQAQDSDSVAATLDNDGDASLQTLWWLTNDDIARIKNHPGTMSTLQLSLTDWLKLVGGFQIKQLSDENAVILTFGGYPTVPREAISFVGRVVDCVRLCVHAGRFCLTHALCEFAQRSLSHVFTDSGNSEAETDIGDVLVKVVERLAKERDRAFNFNSDSKATFCCAFEVQVSMAALARSLRLLYELQTDYKNDPGNYGLDELLVMATRFAKHETTSRKKQTEKYTFLDLFTRDETNKKHNSSTDDTTRLSHGTPSNIILLGQSIMASATQSTMNSLVDNMLKPALSDLQLFADESNIEEQCMVALVIMGYVILGCAQSVCSHVRGDLGVGLSATLTPIDSFIHKIVNTLTSVTSTEPLADLILAPLYALSVSLASTLRRYGKAQHRLEVALNGVGARRRISGGNMIYSELLWSQLIQLQCSLPQETTYALTATAEHERVAHLVHAFGVHPNHLTLSGDWNMLKEPVRHELCEHVFFGGNLFVCTLTDIQIPAPSSVASLAFPRSVLLVGPHLSALAARNCHLQELPMTFGLHFPNMKVCFYGALYSILILHGLIH